MVPAGPVKWTKTRERMFLEHLALSSNIAASERVSATANLAAIGDELVQFARAEQIGPRLFRLNGLLRGRRGIEWAMTGHAVGDRFVLVDADSVAAITVPLAAIGSSPRISASGVGDETPAEQSILFQARALRPPARWRSWGAGARTDPCC